MCNPTAALLALASMLRQIADVGRRLRRTLVDTIAAGDGTANIDRNLATNAFTASVSKRLQSALATA